MKDTILTAKKPPSYEVQYLLLTFKITCKQIQVKEDFPLHKNITFKGWEPDTERKSGSGQVVRQLGFGPLQF